MPVQVLIIGGGLSGVTLAQALQTKGLDWQLLEARDRFGGRILDVDQHIQRGFGPDGYDMGPTWIWPHQHGIRTLAAAYGVELMPQFTAGHLIFEDSSGAVQRDLTFAPMAGALRVAGGLSKMIGAIVATLEHQRMHSECIVTAMRRTANGLVTDTKSINGTRKAFEAENVILALPPRLAAAQIDLSDLLDPSAVHAMRKISTWMANSGKVMIGYEAPFWREHGFSGNVISHRGPLMEIHDACPAPDEHGNSVGALFGFVHPQIVAMRPSVQDLETAVQHQLVTLFGEEAGNFSAISTKLWLNDPFTATDEDQMESKHPSGGRPAILDEAEDLGLFFAGAEVSETDPGLLEGAVTSAQDIAKHVSAIAERAASARKLG